MHEANHVFFIFKKSISYSCNEAALNLLRASERFLRALDGLLNIFTPYDYHGTGITGAARNSGLSHSGLLTSFIVILGSLIQLQK